jgi:hypothetical protein
VQNYFRSRRWQIRCTVKLVWKAAKIEKESHNCKETKRLWNLGEDKLCYVRQTTARWIFAGPTTWIENTVYMLPIIGMPQKTKRLPTYYTPTTSNLSDLFRPLLSVGPKAHVHFHHAIAICRSC